MGLAKSRAIPVQLIVGLGTMAYQNSSSVSIGTLSLSTALSVANGGTGATSASAARTNLGFADGEALPSLVNVTNVAASTPSDLHYAKIGSHVVYGMRLTMDVTTGATATELGIPLPIASNFTLFTQASGTVTSADQAGLSYAVRADITNDRLALRGISGAGTGNYEFSIEGSYRIF